MSKDKFSIFLAMLVIGLLAISMTACTTTETAAAADLQEQGKMNMGGRGEASMENMPDNTDKGAIHSEEHEWKLSEQQSQGLATPHGNQGNGQGQLAGNGRNSEQEQGQGQGNGGQGRGQGGQGRGTNARLEPLNEAEIEALIRAIEEEFSAQAIYQSILDDFGNVEPFNNIVNSEAQHAATLVRMAGKYGVPVPDFPDSRELPSFDTLEEACQAGVEAEIVDAQLYDEIMQLTSHEDLLRVYTNLRNASLNNHLPEFESCQ